MSSKYAFLVLLWLSGVGNCFSQKLLYKGSKLDSLTIRSVFWYYHFDDKGTTTAKIDEIYFVYDEHKEAYRVSNYNRRNIYSTYKPDTVIRTAFSIGCRKKVDSTELKDLLLQLQTADSIVTIENSGISYEELLRATKKKKVHNNLKRYHQLKDYFLYSFKDERQDFFSDLRNVDTLNLYLSSAFRSGGYPIVTDFGDSFWISVSTDSLDNEFEGKYPDVFRQPLYDNNDAFSDFYLLNLKINKSLVALLPKRFGRIHTIETQALFDDYIRWLLKRRKFIYD